MNEAPNVFFYESSIPLVQFLEDQNLEIFGFWATFSTSRRYKNWLKIFYETKQRRLLEKSL